MPGRRGNATRTIPQERSDEDQVRGVFPRAGTRRVYEFAPHRISGASPIDRLKRIEANYEKDKAMLAKERAPALARSDTHDVGHAEGVDVGAESNRSEIKRMSSKLKNQIKTILNDDF